MGQLRESQSGRKFIGSACQAIAHGGKWDGPMDLHSHNIQQALYHYRSELLGILMPNHTGLETNLSRGLEPP